MYNSYQIANFFIKRSQDTGLELTPMKLIKLCYIAHGWHLGLYDTQLLDEVIYAWKYGPVIDSIYHEFKKYGSNQIPELYKDDTCDEYPLPDENVTPFLNAIWSAYGKRNGVELSAMTHQPGTPWDIAWKNSGGKSHTIIPNELIKSHYKEKANAASAATTTATAATLTA